jgi:hypothetical protein
MVGSPGASSAKADDPVFREGQRQISRAGILDAPLSQELTRAIFARNRLDHDPIKLIGS